MALHVAGHSPEPLPTAAVLGWIAGLRTPRFHTRWLSLAGILQIALLLAVAPAIAAAERRPPAPDTSVIAAGASSHLSPATLWLAVEQTLRSWPPDGRLANGGNVRLQDNPAQRSWIARHPALFGALVGFGGGFAVGWATGHSSARGDPSSDYLTPEANGLLVGGVGAGIGALVGWAIGR